MKSLLTYRHFAKVSLATTLFAMLFATAAFAAEHGYVSAIMEPDPKEKLFPVNIEQINGKEIELGPINRLPVGSNEVLVSLVFNASWGSGMAATQEQIYTKTIKLDVEKGKTYYLGAKVDTDASAQAQADGSFWTPEIVRVR